MTRAPVLFMNAKNMSGKDFSKGKEIYRVFVKITLPIEWIYFFDLFPSAIINACFAPCLLTCPSCGNNVKQTVK